MTGTGDASTFESHRDHLFGIAYRMTGRVSAAEDIVQEAYLRWTDIDADEVRSPRSYLSTVVTRLALDELDSAKTRREEYVGPWLPEPLAEDSDGGRRISPERAESLSMAFLTLLQTLTPVQRAVFLLREVFDYGYDEIAEIVGKQPSTCRKVAQRARERVDAGELRFEPSEEEHRRLVEQFFAAVEQGDVERLETTLAEDAVLYSDGGGRVTAARRPVRGANPIARFMVGIAARAPEGLSLFLTRVNGRTGCVARVEGSPQSAWAFHVEDGEIQRVYAVVNPEKLRALSERKG